MEVVVHQAIDWGQLLAAWVAVILGVLALGHKAYKIIDEVRKRQIAINELLEVQLTNGDDVRLVNRIENIEDKVDLLDNSLHIHLSYDSPRIEAKVDSLSQSVEQHLDDERAHRKNHEEDSAMHSIMRRRRYND